MCIVLRMYHTERKNVSQSKKGEVTLDKRRNYLGQCLNVDTQTDRRMDIINTYHRLLIATRAKYKHCMYPSNQVQSSFNMTLLTLVTKELK